MNRKEVAQVSRAARQLLELLEKEKEHEAIAAELRLLITWTEDEYFNLLELEKPKCQELEQ